MSQTPQPSEIAAQRWQLIVTEHRASFGEIARLAAQFPNDGALGALRCRAEAGLRTLDRDAANPDLIGPFSFLGHWGQNGQGPRIKAMLVEARLRAEKLADARAVAA
jgi:hypothetical protein